MVQSALVIGGAGFLGTAIVSQLSAAGWATTVMGRGHHRPAPDSVPFIQVDRKQPGALAAASAGVTFDLVVDCAAYFQPDVDDAIATFATLTGHYVFISTDFVYAPSIAGPFPIGEDYPKETERSYGVGKLACEAALQSAWQASKFPFTALRPPHIMGAGKELGTGSVEGRDPTLLQHLRAGEGLTLLGEGLLLIQPVFHREVGDAIAHLAGNPASFGQVYNCTSPQCVTTRVYYEMVAERIRVPLRAKSMPIAEYLAAWPDKAPFARHRMYDLTRLTATTGYKPHWSLGEALDETVAWLEARG